MGASAGRVSGLCKRRFPDTVTFELPSLPRAGSSSGAVVNGALARIFLEGGGGDCMSRTRMRLVALATCLMLLLPVLAACGGTSSTGGGSSAHTIKVGLVTDTGGLNDKGFNSLANQGLQKAKSELGIQADVTQSTKASDYVPNLTNFASRGYDLVIAVGFLMASAVGQVSQQYPNVKFALIDSTPADASGNSVTRSNVTSLLFKEQEAGALVGILTGM